MVAMRLAFIEGEGRVGPPFSCPNKATKAGLAVFLVLPKDLFFCS